MILLEVARELERGVRELEGAEEMERGSYRERKSWSLERRMELERGIGAGGRQAAQGA